jgi:putative SOS response-associated peptidase YedK
MCGRIVQTTPFRIVAQDFGLDRDNTSYSPRFNIPPGSRILVVRANTEGAIELAKLRWGLIPGWAKDEKIAWNLTNARVETVREKPAFRESFKKRRCLVAVDGFYEWRNTPEGKIPYFIRLVDERVFYLGGLWESWKAPSGEVIETCTILTRAANEQIMPVHDRMPLIVARENHRTWLDSANPGLDGLESLLEVPAGPFTMTRVSTLVNSPKNDSPACLEGCVTKP